MALWTDSKVERPILKNTILIMTTNAGAAEMDSGSIGINKSTVNNAINEIRLLRTFLHQSLEIGLAQLFTLIKLDEVQVVQIVEKFVNDLAQKLQKRSINFEISSDALKWFAKEWLRRQNGR